MEPVKIPEGLMCKSGPFDAPNRSAGGHPACFPLGPVAVAPAPGLWPQVAVLPMPPMGQSAAGSGAMSSSGAAPEWPSSFLASVGAATTPGGALAANYAGVGHGVLPTPLPLGQWESGRTVGLFNGGQLTEAPAAHGVAAFLPLPLAAPSYSASSLAPPGAQFWGAPPQLPPPPAPRSLWAGTLSASSSMASLPGVAGVGEDAGRDGEDEPARPAGKRKDRRGGPATRQKGPGGYRPPPQGYSSRPRRRRGAKEGKEPLRDEGDPGLPTEAYVDLGLLVRRGGPSAPAHEPLADLQPPAPPTAAGADQRAESGDG